MRLSPSLYQVSIAMPEVLGSILTCRWLVPGGRLRLPGFVPFWLYVYYLWTLSVFSADLRCQDDLGVIAEVISCQSFDARFAANDTQT
jgi:hypothetical protein